MHMRGGVAKSECTSYQESCRKRTSEGSFANIRRPESVRVLIGQGGGGGEGSMAPTVH